ncbi:hypothetical protein IWQ61_009982 [Dispira simplex]|nr:hypothetical protein IWQ61_009982 [Dispira simplex]
MKLPDWSLAFFQFFDRLGLTETVDTLQTELLTFSSVRHQPVLIEELKQLHTALGEFIDTVTKESPPNVSEETVNEQQRQTGRTDAAENSALQAKVQEMVQVRANQSEIEKRIKYFKMLKRAEINHSNQLEYFGDRSTQENGVTCARVDLHGVNRAVQMKQDVVHNDHDPLMRLQGNVDNKALGSDSTGSPYSSALEERIRNIEDHLQIPFGKYIDSLGNVLLE